MASSRVGTTTSVLTTLSSLPSTSSLLSNGGVEAAVLPVPVCAQAIRSLPSRITGMVASCTGVISSKFMS